MVLEGLSQPLKHSSLTMCSMPRPVHTVLIKASQENHPRKQKAVHLKRKQSKVKRTGREECYVSQLPPPRLGVLLRQEAASTEH